MWAIKRFLTLQTNCWYVPSIKQNNVTNPILSLDLTSENDIDKFNECFSSEEQSLKKES